MGISVLIVGGGGREHALAWKIAKSPLVSKVYAAPGNPGVAQHAECVPLAADDLDGLRKFAVAKAIDLTVVGPEAPLAAGLTDLLTKKGLLVCGPDRAGAQMEGSKVFMKTILRKYGIPTASFKVFDEYDEAEQYLLTHRLPVVIKADGLAAGKGVVVAQTYEEGIAFLKDVMERRVFGAAGERVVIEECLPGEEASYIVFTDGDQVRPASILAGPQEDRGQRYRSQHRRDGGVFPRPRRDARSGSAGASGDLRAAACGSSCRGDRLPRHPLRGAHDRAGGPPGP